jgi:integrase
VTRVRVRGFKLFRDRHGKWRCYHRRTGKPIDLVKAPLGTAAFFAACAAIAAEEATQVKVVAAKPGTLGLLIHKYCASDAFGRLKPRTQADYQRIFAYLKPIEDAALARFDPPMVARIRDKAAARGYRHANYVRQVLSILFGWGAERGLIATNPAAVVMGIRRPADRPDANRPWTDAERHVVLEAAAPHLRTVLALMMYTGIGPKDAISLPRTAYRDGVIRLRRSKTGTPIHWPVVPQLADELTAAEPHEATTLCVSSLGRPWSQDGLQVAFQRLKAKLAGEGRVGADITLYGLRHTVAVILREAGLDERTIADALGHSTIEMARHYARGADLGPKMQAVSATLDAELNRRKAKLLD